MGEKVDKAGFLRALGSRVKNLRIDRGWSNIDIVVKHGIHDSQWRRYERGQGMTVETLLRLSKCFNLKLVDFLVGVEFDEQLEDELPDDARGTRRPKEIAKKVTAEVAKKRGKPRLKG